MTSKKLTLFILFTFCIVLTNCVNKEKKTTSTLYAKVDVSTDNYKYPTDSTTIKKWISNNSFNAIHKHGWYIWQHLTNLTDNGKIRYQTWSSPQQILKKMEGTMLKASNNELLFRKPSQFSHAKLNQKDFDDVNVVEVVAYNKAAEQYAIDNKIFYLSSLKKLEKNGYNSIPEFPQNAITIKPVYKIITQNKLSSNGIYTMAAWRGPEYNPKGYPEKDWGSCIYIDTKQDKSNPNGVADFSCSNKNNDNTFYLNDFIHFKITENQAKSYNKEIRENIKKDTTLSKKEKQQQMNLRKAIKNDIALLVGMHVGTKETKRWTWQTYWWSATPYNPNTPSSNEIASARNGIKLHKAANHYAMASAYSMLVPVQPYIGGKNVGEPVIAYNPYLESGFGNRVFNESKSYIINNDNKIKTNLGTLTNCISCHMAAAVNTKTLKTPPYIGDTYISQKDSIFKNKITLDFSWSIQNNIDNTK